MAEFNEHAVTENLSRLKTEELQEKVKQLTVQLAKAADDFDERLNSFYQHMDNLRKIVAISRKMRKSWVESDMKTFEKKKKELKKAIVKHRKNILTLFGNIKIIKQEEDIMLKTDRELERELNVLRGESLGPYRILKTDATRFHGIAKEKIDRNLKDSEQLILDESRLIAVLRKLVPLMAKLDPILERINYYIEREDEELAYIEADHGRGLEKGKSLDMSMIANREKYLLKIVRLLYEKLREEKTEVHDPFRVLIREEKSGMERALDLLSAKKRWWWKNKKITQRDIREVMATFTETEEYNTFFSALMSHPELMAKKTYDNLQYYFSNAQKELKKTKADAYTDKLTQLYNKGYYSDAIRNLVKRKTEFSILVLDIDHFKKFNDKYDHQIGDKVLVETSAIIKDSVRATDVVCRYGGEEIVVLMPRTNLEDATVVSERIRKNVEKHDLLNFSGEKIDSITLSGGLLHVDAKMINPEQSEVIQSDAMFKEADKRLYTAKNSGRNRVVAGEYLYQA